LVESIADWDVEVRYLTVVEYKALGWLIEAVLIMEDALLEAM
jgi:hypothetical protein